MKPSPFSRNPSTVLRIAVLLLVIALLAGLFGFGFI